MPKLIRTYKKAMWRYQLSLLVMSLVYWNIVIRLAIFMRILGARDHDMSEMLSKGMIFLVDEVLLSSVVI